MNTIATTSIVFLITLVGSGHSAAVLADPTDLTAALAFIQCTQKALLTGIPEAGIPSHNPLKFHQNYTFNYSLLLDSIEVHLDNLQMDGIPFWNVTEAVQSLSDPDVDIFNFTIYWPMMSVSGDWNYITKSLLEENTQNGTFYIELDHVNFVIGWRSTKPTSENNGTLNEFTIQTSTEDVLVNVTNLDIIGDLLNSVGGSVVKYFFNNNPAVGEFNEQVKEKVVRDWVQKPERIDAINENCKT